MEMQYCHAQQANILGRAALFLKKTLALYYSCSEALISLFLCLSEPESRGRDFDKLRLVTTKVSS